MHATLEREPRIETKAFLLGLPYVSNGPLLDTARELGASVLISANALSVRKDDAGIPRWDRFRTSSLRLLSGMDAYLDSAGFVAAARYRGYDWSVGAYMDLVAAHPWRWAAAMDFCVEPELAGTRTVVLDRISETIASLRLTLRAARERGVEDRIMPVVQGWDAEDYARCLDRMPGIAKAPLLGLGSVCRRHVNGPSGVLAILDRIDHELGDAPAKLHLFGVKGSAIPHISSHPRVASFDSQAYGIRARIAAREGGFPKTNVYLASVMRSWYLTQQGAIAAGVRRPALARVAHQPALDLTTPNAFEDRLERAREEMRALIESGDMDATDLNDDRVLQWAFEDDEL